MLCTRAARIWFSRPIQSLGTCSVQSHTASAPHRPAISVTRGSERFTFRTVGSCLSRRSWSTRLERSFIKVRQFEGRGKSDLGQRYFAAALFAAAEAGDQELHELDGFLEGKRPLAGAQVADECLELRLERKEGVTGRHVGVARRADELEQAEAAVHVGVGDNDHIGAVAMFEMNEIAVGRA